MRFLARLLLNGIAIIIAAYVVPGLHLAGPGAAILAGAFLGFANAIIRPILLVLTFPLTLLTLGLFIFVINAVCLALTAYVIPGFSIDGFGPAFLGALLVTVVSWILSGLLVGKPEKKRD
jgi:putative membrane protein